LVPHTQRLQRRLRLTFSSSLAAAAVVRSMVVELVLVVIGQALGHRAQIAQQKPL
jgi:hypothetical protein